MLSLHLQHFTPVESHCTNLPTKIHNNSVSHIAPRGVIKNELPSAVAGLLSFELINHHLLTHNPIPASSSDLSPSTLLDLGLSAKANCT